MKKLSFVGVDDWDRPVYSDEEGGLWKDVNLGQGEPYLHSSSNGKMDGEPDSPIKGEYEIGEPYKENRQQLQYMMLDRLRSNCDYYTGYGHTAKITPTEVASIIGEMKAFWSELEEKPDWLTWEQILAYEKALLAPKRANRYLDD